MFSLANDIRHAIRLLSKHKTFSVMAIITLALAIGANTAIFSVARALLLDPLPYANASGLVIVWEDDQHLGFSSNTPAPANYADWKAQNSVFQGMSASRPRGYNLTGAGEPERLQAQQVTSDFFTVLGVTPILGRSFRAEEDHPDATKVVLLGADLWKTRFGSSREIVGKQILLDDTPHIVVGVMPNGFDFPRKGTQIWTPIAFSSQDLTRRDVHYLQVVARLKPGVSQTQAQKEMDVISQRLGRDYPQTNAESTARVVPLRDELVGKTDTAVFLLLAIAACVLLIASANLANILLARAMSRQREIGIRIALGAGRSSLLRQLFTENVILSAAGAILGLGLAEWSLEFLSVLIPEDMTSAKLALDGRMLLFTILLTIVTTFLFGAVPARQAWRFGIIETLGQGGSRSGEERSTHRMRGWLVVSQTAFTFVLLVAGGLMLRTFTHLNSVDPGFRGEQVLTMRTALPTTRYRGVPARTAFYTPVLERIQALPGVVDAGFTSWLPYRNYGGTSGFVIEGEVAQTPSQENDANIRLVTPGYLAAMGMTLLEGRLLTTADHAGTEPVAVINRTMARKFWPAGSPMNHRLRNCQDCPWLRIVGIVGDMHQKALDVDARPEYFVPFDQLPQLIAFGPPQDLAIRVAGDPVALTSAARKAIWSVDAQQPVTQVRILADYVREDLAPRRFQTQLIGTFAGLALLLASLGIYGVLSYVVSQRRREIGVRMALGADGGQVARLVIGQGMRPALMGLAIGFGVAYGLAHLISGLLYGVDARDPLTFSAAAAVLLTTAFLASWIPARRASRVDPGSVLHYE